MPETVCRGVGVAGAAPERGSMGAAPPIGSLVFARGTWKAEFAEVVFTAKAGFCVEEGAVVDASPIGASGTFLNEPAVSEVVVSGNERVGGPPKSFPSS